MQQQTQQTMTTGDSIADDAVECAPLPNRASTSQYEALLRLIWAMKSKAAIVPVTCDEQTTADYYRKLGNNLRQHKSRLATYVPEFAAMRDYHIKHTPIDNDTKFLVRFVHKSVANKPVQHTIEDM